MRNKQNKLWREGIERELIIYHIFLFEEDV